MSLEPGQILDGKYRISKLLGKGGMGTVWFAENVRVRRNVAIKVLNKEAASGGDARVRFEREAQAAGQIGSDHIVEVLDLGTTDDGERFMVMEYLEGETLKQRMRRGRLLPDKVSAIFRQLLDGLGAAHAAGIIHRDLKPDNIFLQREKAGQRDWVKLLDFGISKFSQMSAEDGQTTTAGMVMGTPFYMSPEQARTTQSVDARSDLYTVGVMLFEVLTGQVPFNGTTFAELLFKIAFEPPPHPKSVMPTLDDQVCWIIQKAMDRDPAARFQSAAEFHAALADWDTRRAGAPVQALPPPPQPPQRTVPLPTPPPRPVIVGQLPLPPASAGPTVPLPASAPAPGLDPEDGAATHLWPGGPTPPPMSGPPASFPSGSLTPASDAGPPVMTGETQKAWNGAAVVAPPAKRGNGVLFVVLGSVGIAVAAATFFALRAPGSTGAAAGPVATAPVTAAAATSAPPAATTAPTVSAAPTTPTASAALTAPTVTATTAPEPPARSSRPGAATRPGAAATTAHPAAAGKKVVTDYGY